MKCNKCHKKKLYFQSGKAYCPDCGLDNTRGSPEQIAAQERAGAMERIKNVVVSPEVKAFLER